MNKKYYNYNFFIILIIISSFIFISCGQYHPIEPGQTSGNALCIDDGTVILLRRNKEYAAIIPQWQGFTDTGEEIIYKWYKFDIKDSTIIDSGTGKVSGDGGGLISIGSINTEWSIHGDHEGWIYYGNYSGNVYPPIEIVYTGIKDISKIDPHNPHWGYRSGEAEEGQTLNYK